MGTTGADKEVGGDPVEAIDTGTEEHNPVTSDNGHTGSMLGALNNTSPASAWSTLNLRWLTAVFVLAALLIGAAGALAIVSWRGPSTQVEFAKPTEDIGPVCASGTVEQQNELLVNIAAAVKVVSTIYDELGNVYYPTQPSIDLAIEELRQIKAIFIWTVPILPPGNYTRVIVATILSTGESATSITTFSTVDCSQEP